ncbi:MAG: hypothetical protein ACKVVP_23680 [Chloroflexota bacterium]
MNRVLPVAMATIMMLSCSPAVPAPKPAEKASEVAPSQKVAPVAPPEKPAAVPPASAKPNFDALLQKAKAGAATSDGRIRSSLSDVEPDVIRAWESEFEKRFGIKIHLDNEPGHITQEVVPRFIQAFKSGKGIVDWFSTGTTASQTMLMREGALRVPPWEALAEEWPQVNDLRKLFPDSPGGPGGTKLSDHCMLSRQGIYTFVYNTRKVKADEVKNITWDDLLTEQWRNRVAFQDGAGGLYIIPFHKDWPPERMNAYGQNLGTNGLKLPSGGSAGVVQAVSQGEADIGITVSTTALDDMARGAPLALAWPDVVPTNHLVTCLPSLSANNQDLASLFFGWRNFEGEWIISERGSGGARPFFAPEADSYPIGKLIREAGLTAEKNLSEPRTEKDVEQLEVYRQSSLQAMKTGIQTGTKVPYPWGCAKNHPSCVSG